MHLCTNEWQGFSVLPLLAQMIVSISKEQYWPLSGTFNSLVPKSLLELEEFARARRVYNSLLPERALEACCIPLGRLPRALGSMSSGSGGDIGASSSGSHSLTLTAGLPGPHPTRLPSSWVPPTLKTVPLWVVLLSISAACTASRRSARIDTCGASARRAPVWHYDRLGSRALPCSL